MTATREAYRLKAEVTAFEDGEPFAARRFDETIARDLA